MTTTIEGSVAFVTGSNRGIGKAFVEVLIGRGASKVYAAARNPDALDELVRTAPDKIIPIALDVTNEEQIEAAAAHAKDVNILINNAGISCYSAVIASPDIKSARQEMEVNYFGVLNLTRAFAPVLAGNGGGAVANISSVGGLVNFPMFGTYCASKAAVTSMTQGARAELAAQGTQVIGVFPGPIDTDMAAGVDMEKETPIRVAERVLDGMENGAEDIFPDAMAEDMHQGILNDPKAVEKQCGEWLPQPMEA